MALFRMLICGSGRAGLEVGRLAAADGRGEVVGLFDPDPGQLKLAGEEFPNAVAGNDYPALLAKLNPEVVVVAGPDHLHADQAIAALQHGCHVMLEKPLATTVADARRILDAEKKAGRHVMADHTMRYVYPWRETALAARSGKVGRIFFVQGDYIHDMWDFYSPQGIYYTPWRADAKNPQNILLGGGCHAIDLMLWAIDSPVVEVFAYCNKLSIPEFPADDSYIVIMRFENGAMGKVFVTSGCSGHGGPQGTFLDVYGTDGTIANGQFLRRNQEAKKLDNTSSGNVTAGHGWGGSVKDFLDLLEGKIPNPIPARAAARTVAVCEAALLAIRTGQPQKPSPI